MVDGVEGRGEVQKDNRPILHILYGNAHIVAEIADPPLQLMFIRCIAFTVLFQQTSRYKWICTDAGSLKRSKHTHTHTHKTVYFSYVSVLWPVDTASTVNPHIAIGGGVAW